MTNPSDKILVALRPADKSQGNVWEFPGGKIELNETPEQAIARELDEEIGITPASMQLLLHYTYLYQNTLFDITVFHISHFTGQAHGKEGQLIHWVNAIELYQLPMLAGNPIILEAIQKNFLLPKAIRALQAGEIIAYPTEGVYGLGCDPLQESAVLNLLALKNRSIDQGLILVAATVDQILPYILPIPSNNMEVVLNTWPGPVTWVFPASPKTPVWIRGISPTVAIRISAHPIVNMLCNQFDSPLVSTSANPHGQSSAQTAEDVVNLFPKGLGFVLPGKTGGLGRPTEIRDALSHIVIR